MPGDRRIWIPWMALKQYLLGILFSHVAPLGHGLLQVADVGERPSATHVAHCARGHGICRVERSTSGRPHSCAYPDNMLKHQFRDPMIICDKNIALGNRGRRKYPHQVFSAGTVIFHISNLIYEKSQLRDIREPAIEVTQHKPAASIGTSKLFSPFIAA